MDHASFSVHHVATIKVAETDSSVSHGGLAIWRTIIITTDDGGTVDVNLFSDSPAKLSLPGDATTDGGEAQ